MNTARILLIDDHPLFRKGLAQLVDSGLGLTLAGEVGSGAEGVARARELDPDLILIDLNMKPMGGIDTLRALKADGTRGRCIVLTVSDDGQDVLEAMRAGADGYLLKDMEPEALYAQLQLAAGGAVVFGGNVAGVLTQALNTPAGAAPSEAAADLTDRETEILGRVAAGLSNKEIARELGISYSTVKVHLKHVMRKLNVKSRLEAAVWALQRPGSRDG